MPHEYEDNEDREPPYNAAVATEQGINGGGGYTVPVPVDYTLRGYKSTAVMLDGHGTAVTVEVGWRHSDDLAGIVMLETKAQATADASTLLFVNQGDILDHVTLTGGGNIDYSVVESNQLPLPASTDVGDPWPQRQFISLPAIIEFALHGGSPVVTIDALCVHNFYLLTTTQNSYITFMFKMGPQYARHEVVLVGNLGPNYGIQRVTLASIRPDAQSDLGYNNPVALMQNPNTGTPAPTFVPVALTNRYNAALARNTTWGYTFRVEGAEGDELTAISNDSDGFGGVDGGPGIYMMKILLDTKDAASTGYRAGWSEITVNRIGDSGYM